MSICLPQQCVVLVYGLTLWRSPVHGESRAVGHAADCRPQTQNVFPNSPFCALKYFCFCFSVLFFCYFLDPCSETFSCPKVLFSCYFVLCFCCCFFFFYPCREDEERETPAEKTIVLVPLPPCTPAQGQIHWKSCSIQQVM